VGGRVAGDGWQCCMRRSRSRGKKEREVGLGTRWSVGERGEAGRAVVHRRER
jgi:hypothetical protein